jgi:hypothetical protein
MSPPSVSAAIVARYVLLTNVLFCACTSLDLLSFFNCLRIPKTLPFLLPPDAKVNPDFQKCITVGELSKEGPRVRKEQRTHDIRQFLH